MAVTYNDIVRTARSYLGTPWIHQGRLKGVACDCAGLLVMVGKDNGLLPDFKEFPYARMPHNGSLQRSMQRVLDQISLSAVRVGDVIVMTAPNAEPCHVGIIGNYRHDGPEQPFSIIHAHIESGKVVEHRMTPDWWKIVVAAYRYRYRYREAD